jgi:hypothetical protein
LSRMDTILVFHKSRSVMLAGLLFLGPLSRLASNPAPAIPLASLAGLSGRLHSAFALPGDEMAAAAGPQGERPGIVTLFRRGARAFQLIVMKPFSSKVRGRIGGYRLGRWPFEGAEPANPSYADPKGFIEVTPQNFATRLSEHFTLGQFLTKDQFEVWPKYVVLQSRLLDKLELTIEELRRMGHPVRGLYVMSGFRTPEYNVRGVGEGGRSAISRHVYGDAADVYPDDRGRGRMDDLNGDGRVDLKDARILAAAAEAVEERHPELAGGIGIYPATSAHGPFVHIDARGVRARWGG